MRKTKCVYLIVLIIFPTLVSASWKAAAYKKTNPTQLSYFVFIDGMCPFTKSEYNKVIERGMNKIHVKPKEFEPELQLTTQLKCIKQQENYFFDIAVSFNKYVFINGKEVPVSIIDSINYFGISPNQQLLLEKYTELVNEAIKSYAKANLLKLMDSLHVE